MLLRALALYVILNSIFLATESQKDRFHKEDRFPKKDPFPKEDRFPKKDHFPKEDRFPKKDHFPKEDRFPKKDHFPKNDHFHREHHFFPSNNRRDCYIIRDSNGRYLSINRESKLILDKKYESTLSTFRFEPTGQVNRQGYPVYEIINCGSNKPISWSKLLKENDFNYYVYAKNARRFGDNFSWVVVGQDGSKFVQILDDNGVFNLYSSSTKEDRKRLALVFGGQWPISVSQKENNKPFWTIEFIPAPVIGNKPFFGSIVLDAEDQISETKTSTTTPKRAIDSKEEEEEEEEKEDNEVLAGEIISNTWKPNPKSCYIITSRIFGKPPFILDYRDRTFRALMNQTSERKETSWRFVAEPKSETAYKIQNCKNDFILVAQRGSSTSRSSGLVYAVEETERMRATANTLWVLRETSRGDIFEIVQYENTNSNLYAEKKNDPKFNYLLDLNVAYKSTSPNKLAKEFIIKKFN